MTTQPPARKLRVVIADDSSIMRGRLRQYVGAAGCVIVGEARDGDMAYSVAKKLRPDIAILDILMPPGSGKVAALRLKSEHLVRDVVVISSNSQDFVKGPLVAAGIEWLTKPINDQQIVDLVTRLRMKHEGGAVHAPTES